MALPTNRRGQQRNGAHLISILIGCFLLTAGCSTLGKVTDSATEMVSNIGWKDDAVAQTFAVIPFGNQMPWVADRLHMDFLARLTEALEDKCARVILVSPGDAQYPYDLARFVTPGVTPPDNIELAEICRKAGLNGVITGHLSRISSEQKGTGMLWFKGKALMARVQMEFALHHAGTAAKLLDDTLFMDVELTEDEYNALADEKVLNASATEDELAKTARSAVRSICDRLETVPWEGIVTSVQNNKAFILFGDNVGLSVDDELEVFAEGQILGAAGESRYIVPGIKVGEATITAVSDTQSEVVMREKSGEIKVGSIVRKKD